ncbi:MAG: nicotinate-nucleotide adenylyltransferase [Acidobacteriota bacterium]
MRIGILGGTFDPIHNGHLEMACRVKSFCDCDRLLILPAYSPPHKTKESITSSYHRYAMAVMATNSLADIEVSRLELEAPARPYTVQTIAQLKELHRNAELFFIMGADSFRELESWREYRRLLASCHIVVVSRPGYEIDVAERRTSLQADIRDLRGMHMQGETDEPTILLTNLLAADISATAIRAAVQRGMAIDQWVAKPVAQYIAKYRLYQDKNETEN